MGDKLSVTINGQALEVDKGTTILAAAESIGVEIPTFCYHPGLSAPANCRMCLVNTNKAPKLLPACYGTCMDGMEVTTEDEKTLKTRKSTLEFILLNHPVDCPICDQAGECVLQDNYFNHSASPSRLFTRKDHKPKAEPLGPEVMLDAERCIVCTRCVRFCDEVSKSGELRVTHRGNRSFVTTFEGKQLDNDYSVCTADICPVGALTSRDFRFKMRVWFLKTADTVCSGCSKGCNIHLDHGDGEVQRYRPRENADVNQWWMCDAGRLTYKEFQQNRILSARIGESEHPVREAVGKAARKIAAYGGELAVALSPMLTNEDMAALLDSADALKITRWYMGGRPDGKADDLLLKADKNPNRRGLTDALSAAGKTAATLGSMPADIAAGNVKGVLWFGHEHAADGSLAQSLSKLSLRVHVASNDSEWSKGADVVLPMRTFEEIDGSWTNCDGVVQALQAGPAPKGASAACKELVTAIAARLSPPARPAAQA